MLSGESGQGQPGQGWLSGRAIPLFVLAGRAAGGIGFAPPLVPRMDAPTLFDELATVPDPRSRHGQRHPLSAILGMVALAMLMGRTSLAGIARFGRQHGSALAAALGFTRAKTPSLSTLSRTLAALDAAAVETALARWIAARLDPADAEHVSLDGKTLRGSRDGDVPGVHLVAAYAPHAQAVLAQIRVDAKTNEHKAALELLGILPVAGKVVVGDALFCQRDLAETVVGEGGDYLLVVKDNQEALKVDIQAAFAFEDAARSVAAATSPCGHPLATAAAGAGHDDGGQGSRSGGSADPADHLGAHEWVEVAGAEAGDRIAA